MADQTELIERYVRRVVGRDLEDLIHLMRDYAAPPMFLTADAGSGRLKGTYQAAVAKVDEALTHESLHEIAKLRDELPWHLEDEILARALIECATNDAYSAVQPSALLPGRPAARVFQEHPVLRTRLDDAGLIDLTDLEAHTQVLFCDGRAVQYHPLLRRFFTGHVNATLLGTLLALQDTGRATLKIAVDDEHSMPRAEFSDYIEADYWHGPPLSAESLDDPHAVGTTVHSERADSRERDYPWLFVRWRLDSEGQKVVEIEELAEHKSSVQAGGLHLVRYLHAIRDVDRGKFTHCDGAVRAYTPDAYRRRSAKQFVTGREHATHYRKLFRVDGDIETDEWSDIAAQWFRHNRLILEYLQGLAS